MRDPEIGRFALWIEGWRGAALLAALCLATWGALAFAGFVWDDQALVVGNRYTDTLANLPRFFSTDLWATSEVAEASGYYRPLMLLSLAVDRALWGLSPAGAHLHSVGWHIAGSLLLLALLRELLPAAPAWVGAAIFALHPLQSEAVAWVVARNDLMAATFVFATILAVLPERPGPARLAGGAAAMLAALLSKESALLALVMLLLLDLARWGRPRGSARYLVLGGALAAALGLRAAAGVQASAFEMQAGQALLIERWYQVAALYARRVLFPWPLSVGESVEYLETPPALSLAWLVALAGLVGATLIRGRRLALAGWIFAAAAFAPSLVAVAIRGQLGERYLYLSMAGIGLAVASALPRGAAEGQRWPRGLLVLCGAVLSGWLFLINLRLPDWRDELALFSAAVASSPNGFTYAELGHALNREGRYPEALSMFRLALEDDPPFLDVCPHAVLVPLKQGRLELAWEMARLARERGCLQNPRFVGAYASAAAQVCDYEAAEQAMAHLSDEQLGSRSVVVAAALARRAGDELRVEELRALLGVDKEALEVPVSQLLARCQP